MAANGFLVVVPDFFYGDPIDPDNPKVDRQAWLKAHRMVSVWFLNSSKSQ